MLRLSRGFNPRPARRPGAARVTGSVTHQRTRVSILARPEGRALPDCLQRHAGAYGVSILARPEGRALPRADEYGYTALVDVSILARPEGRALPGPVMMRSRRWRRFNPRPARRPGAANSSHNSSSSTNSFQSSPGPKAGRCQDRGDVGPCPPRVSILARPEGRALPRRSRRGLGGGGVSILARPEGRALPYGDS